MKNPWLTNNVNPRAERAIKFLSKLTLVGKDYAGQPFVPLPFQLDIVRATLAPETRKLFLFIPRKCGKTYLCSALLTYLLLCEGKQQQLYSAAADREQASLAFDTMRAMILADSYLASVCNITPSQKRIECTLNGNVYKALSSESNTKSGLRPDVILLDELAFHPNRDLHDILTSAFGATKHPLTLIVSTAGPDRSQLCHEEFEFAKRVRDGIADDPTYKQFLYYAEPDEDWKDEDVWRRCNPALGHRCQLEFYKNELKQAEQIPTRAHTFRELYLNTWLSDSAAWIEAEKWSNCQVDTFPDLAGKRCYVGIDFSVSTDWTSAVVVVPYDNRFYVQPHFWIPLTASKRREHKDPILWRTWERSGLVHIVSGDVLDHNAIADELAEILKPYKVQGIYCDRAYANNGALRLRDHYNFKVEWFNQGLLNICGPTKALETAILSKKIAHDGNPVLRWQVSNARLTLPDKNGNQQITKAKSSDKVDGVLAMLMAFSQASLTPGAMSVYDKRGPLIF